MKKIKRGFILWGIAVSAVVLLVGQYVKYTINTVGAEVIVNMSVSGQPVQELIGKLINQINLLDTISMCQVGLLGLTWIAILLWAPRVETLGVDDSGEIGEEDK